MSRRVNWDKAQANARMSRYGTDETGSAWKDPNARWTHLPAPPCYRVMPDGSRVLIPPKPKPEWSPKPWTKKAQPKKYSLKKQSPERRAGRMFRELHAGKDAAMLRDKS